MSIVLRCFLTLMMVVGITFGLHAEEDAHKQLPDDIVLGQGNAPITVIEYASLSCPHCAHFHNDVLPTIKEKYIDTGKVKFIFRAFPLDLPALKATALAYCAGNDKFYAFLKVLFDTQESWAPSKNFLEMLANIGKLGGVKSSQFDTCMADKALEDKILQVKLSGANDLEIKATPTFFINGEKFDGAPSVEAFSQLLDSRLTEDSPSAETTAK